MYRIIVSFILLIACVTVLGCSKEPSSKDAKKLAQRYLSSRVPGISEEEISILKTFEKDGTTIVVVQAGGMVCDLSVTKGKDGWKAKGISCNGQFEPQEKATERKRSFLIANMKQTVDDLNKKVPTMSADGTIRTDKYELVNSTVVVYQTNVTANARDMTAKENEDKRTEYLSTACDKMKEMVTNGINYEYSIKDKDGKPLITHNINNETCGKYLQQR
jgi:vacuolar-type H+-ATPase subunit H